MARGHFQCRMTEPHQVTPPVPPARPAAADAAAEDLIGWVIQAQLLDEALLSPESARRVLAAALGVDEPALHAVAPTQLRTALSRLRRLVKLCDELASEAATDDLTGAMRRGM